MRVLSPQAFELSEFPELENLTAMMDVFEAKAVIPFVGKAVYGGFRHGSNTTGGATTLSDSDYFLVVNDERHNEVVHNVVENVFGRTNVFIECVPYWAESAKLGYNRLDKLFILTLRSSIKKRGYVGSDPVAIFQPADPTIPHTIPQAVHESLEHYIIRLDRSYNDQVKGELNRLSLLKEILNKPFDAVRNMLQYYRHMHGMDSDFNDSKAAMLKEYEVFYKEYPELVEIIKQIHSTMASYVKFVEDSRNKYQHISGYMAKLDRIEGQFAPARRFIRENSKLVAPNKP